jgi:hypothetical protein
MLRAWHNAREALKKYLIWLKSVRPEARNETEEVISASLFLWFVSFVATKEMNKRILLTRKSLIKTACFSHR